jgi:cellulose synthase/poly-beta-1,6-N-acetylglucosamine synthase-like glycosyltransferase
VTTAEILSWLAAMIVIGPSLVWMAGVMRWRGQFGRIAPKTGLPELSVIVAGKNEELYVKDCLRSLLALDYPAERIELIFVDDHSSDLTLEIALAVKSESNSRLIVLSAPDEPKNMGSKKRALSHGIEHSHGEFLLFTDADNKVPTGWAKAIVDCYDDRTGAVIGAAIPLRKSGLGSRLYRLERMLVSLTSASQIGWGTPGSACGQNVSMRKSVYEQLGRYAHANIPSGDDDLMMQAIARAGWKVGFAYNAESVVIDRRVPLLNQHLHATTRHQSVVRFYPLRWRILYLSSLLAGILAVALALSAVMSANFLSAFVFAVVCKIVLDSRSLYGFTQRLRIGISTVDFLSAHILLPFYQILRPLFSLRSRYQWRESNQNSASNIVEGHSI